jgi:hypothetical protein
MSHGTSSRKKTQRRGVLCGSFAAMLLASFGSSCNLDPVNRAAVNALGPERDDLYLPESEFHRPGEPCVTCHSKAGPADSEFVLGGTIFWGPKNYDRRVDGAFVRIRDVRAPKCFVTNCSGNFYVRPKEFEGLTFPLLVSVERTEDPYKLDSKRLVLKEMGGHIGREPSCATCHILNTRDYGSPGQIYLYGSEEDVEKLRPPITVPCPNDQKPTILRCPEDRRQ